MELDLGKYIDSKGMVNINTILKDCGYIRPADILNLPIDTVALRILLKVSDKTLCRYINAGLIVLDPCRRIRLGDAMKLDARDLKRKLSIRQPFKVKPDARHGDERTNKIMSGTSSQP